jgi:hypothetical protein
MPYDRRGENIMRRLLMTSTLLAGLAAIASPAFAESPMSKNASNIDQGDTHSVIAPQLPDPDVGDNAGPQALLKDASQALASNQTGKAQEALERAETRLLTRTTAPDQAQAPDNTGTVQMISSARMAIAHGDMQAANSDIQQALGTLPQDQASATN